MARKQRTLAAQYIAARKAGVPLVGVATSDPAATMREIDDAVRADAVAAGLPDAAVLQWDRVSGAQARNEAGRRALAHVLSQEEFVGANAAAFASPVAMLRAATYLPPDTVLYLLNAHRALEGEGGTGVNSAVAQALWNLRDVFKADGRMAVLLAPALTLPVELTHDVVLLEEALPDDAALSDIVTRVYRSAPDGVPVLTDDVRAKALDALRGLPAYAAEQAVAMCLTPDGLALDALWDAKRAVIEQTPGLSVTREKVTFADMGGVAAIKRLARALRDGPEPPALVLWIDEIEKTGLGNTGDTSGTNSDALGVFLTATQEHEMDGVVLVGHAGSGKSMAAKAFGAELGVPTLFADFGAAKSKYVGESERLIRGLVRTVVAIGGSRVFLVATCNSLEGIPPALKRRFRLGGTYMFDLPRRDEKDAIWPICRAKYHIPEQPLPDDTDWTGADIDTCCRVAYKLGLTLVEAAGEVTPVAKTDPDAIRALRALAHNRFKDAGVPGATYTYDGRDLGEPKAPPLRDTKERRIRA